MFFPTGGLNFIAEFLAAGGGSIDFSAKVGTSTTPTTLSMTDLVAPVSSTTATVSVAIANMLRVTASFGPGFAANLEEYGLFMNSTMYLRAVGPQQPKLNDETVLVDFEITYPEV